MRTRRLTCPLSAHRKQLETEYFEKSVKKTIPKWFNKLRQWQESRSHNEHNNTILNALTTNKLNDATAKEYKNTENINNKSKIHTLMVPHTG